MQEGREGAPLERQVVSSLLRKIVKDLFSVVECYTFVQSFISKKIPKRFEQKRDKYE